MRYQVDQWRVAVDKQKDLKDNISSYFHIKEFTYRILSRAIDARKKNEVYYVYRLLIDTKEKLIGKNIIPYQEKKIEMHYPQWKYKDAPIIVGFGPAGIFAALYLARCGAKPVILERGSKIEKRKKDVEDFFKNKVFNPKSNVQFGEGGAGAFSDGKLTTNLKNPYIKFILDEFYKHGAKEDILYDAMPHVGTDYLAKIVASIREEILSLGGQFYFDTTFTTAEKENNMWKILTENGLVFHTKHLLLGLGHSAKDTIRNLYHNLNLHMEAKAFSMGVRVEHPSSFINRAQYGRFAKYLPPAYYKFAHHGKDRNIYTFCMCPGGYVLASQSEDNSIVTNGMSNQNRAGSNSNAALLVEIKPSDFGLSPMAGLDFQEKYERLAFDISKDYRAPANLIGSFLKDEIATSLKSIPTTYPHGLVFCDFNRCLPSFVVEHLKEGILAFDKKLKGFACQEAVMVGIESRSSSPVRIVRNEKRQASEAGIYPIGEGAGYAGGITSAALDGLLTAIHIAEEEQA